jgi:hypothetical protein
MANLLDYLNWRGDLTLAQAPFNEVDNLILAELSFVNFGGIVPPPGGGKGVPLKQAAEAFFAKFAADEPIEMGVLVPDAIPDMLQRMACSLRFGDMMLNCFADRLDVEAGEQFAALTVDTGDGALYLSFRGTDDTLAGWKEDFEMACMPEVPAQKKALEYSLAVAKQFPRKKLRLGGHSKGGNLAVYAGVFCPEKLQNRVIDIWSNDGPGFHMDLLELPEYRRVADRVRSIVPKSSVVGMLLEHSEEYTVVDSDQLGFMQHDGFSWQVMGNHFITLRQVSPKAHLSDQELRSWVQRLSVEQREKFVTALFDVLTASGAVTLTDLKAESYKAVGPMIKAMTHLDKETREGLMNFAGILFKSNFRLVLEGIQEETEKKSNTIRRIKKRLEAETKPEDKC